MQLQERAIGCFQALATGDRMEGAGPRQRLFRITGGFADAPFMPFTGITRLPFSRLAVESRDSPGIHCRTSALDSIPVCLRLLAAARSAIAKRSLPTTAAFPARI